MAAQKLDDGFPEGRRVNFDLTSVSSISVDSEQLNASEFIQFSALLNTVGGLAQCMKKANFPQYFAQFQAVNISVASTPTQS